MDSLIIREANINDCVAVYELNKNSLGYDNGIETTRRVLERIILKGTDKIFVAELSGGIVGYCHAADYDCTYDGHLKLILCLAVAESAQGCGVGKALEGAAEAWAKSDNAVGMRLTSGVERESAHRFYEARGYHVKKEMKVFVKYFNDSGRGA